MKEGSKPEYPEKTPDDELQKMPHIKVGKFKSVSPSTRRNPIMTRLPHTKASKCKHKRDSNPHSRIGGKLGKKMC